MNKSNDCKDNVPNMNDVNMKGYRDYMNNITANPDLYDKIVKRVEEHNVAKSRLSGLVFAGVAVVLLGIWIIVGINNQDSSNNGSFTNNEPTTPMASAPEASLDTPAVSDEITLPTPLLPPNSGRPPYTAPYPAITPPLNPLAEARELPSPTPDNYTTDQPPASHNIVTTSPPTLALNQATSYTAVSRRFIEGHFWYDLTVAQKQALLPNLGFPVQATAHYYGSGRLFEINIHEITYSGETAHIGEFYRPRTMIRLSPDGIFWGVLFDYEPIVSYIHGVAVTAAVFNPADTANDGIYMYFADFQLGGVFYSVRIYDHSDYGADRLMSIVTALIQNGGMDLTILHNPVIPELRDEVMNLIQATQDDTFGAYMPVNVPTNFRFDHARRMLDQQFNGLIAFWDSGSERIHWQIEATTEHQLSQVVCPSQREKFDLTLYPPPWFNLPWEQSRFLSNPVFHVEDLTFEIVLSRMETTRRGSQRFHFGILYGDVVVIVSTEGLTAEQVWGMLGF